MNLRPLLHMIIILWPMSSGWNHDGSSNSHQLTPIERTFHSMGPWLRTTSSEMIGVTMVSVAALSSGSTLSSAMTVSLDSVVLLVAASLFSTSICSTTGGSDTITFS